VRSRTALDEPLQLASAGSCDVCERAERPGGEQGIARALEHTHVPREVGHQRLHKGRLATAGLGTDEHQPPVTLRELCGCLSESLQVLIALEEQWGCNGAHRQILRLPRCPCNTV
jgi:hypothetical protein